MHKLKSKMILQDLPCDLLIDPSRDDARIDQDKSRLGGTR